MRLSRMTTRRWIVAVVISAALLGIFVEIDRELRLRSRYRAKARMHGLQEEVLKGTVFRGTSGAAGVYAYSTADPERAAYHAEMRRKYEYAALHPWLVIEPDLPQP
jgi:hypothetical protein